MLEAATESYNWLGFELVKNYGKDWDVFDYNEPKPKFNSVTEVIGSLRLIGQTHPTRSVRRLANELKNSIDSHYSSHIGYGEEFGEPILGGTPTVDKLSRWIEKCDNLIELMHEPPNLEDVRGPVDKHG